MYQEFCRVTSERNWLMIDETKRRCRSCSKEVYPRESTLTDPTEDETGSKVVGRSPDGGAGD